MSYDFDKIAAELTVERGDLLSVLGIFFDEAETLIAQAEAAYANSDWTVLAEKLHALKGSSANLRLEKLNSLTVKLEDGAKTKKTRVVDNLLPMLKTEIANLKKEAH
jgi:HPt (histidine-containing phosphotransfer) domain-containing protein